MTGYCPAPDYYLLLQANLEIVWVYAICSSWHNFIFKEESITFIDFLSMTYTIEG